MPLLIEGAEAQDEWDPKLMRRLAANLEGGLGEINPSALELLRSVTIAAEAGGRATLSANASAEAPRRVVLVGGASTVVRLVSVDVTGGHSTAAPL